MVYENLSACDAYNKGLQERIEELKENPQMEHAIYKIMRCHRELHDIQDELVRVGEHERGNSVLENEFILCESSNTFSFVRWVVASSCYSIGNKVAGVSLCFYGDGLSKEDVSRINKEVRRRIPAILELGETAHVQLMNQWSLVCKLLGTGSCSLDEFITKCVELIDWVLDVLIIAAPKDPFETFNNYAIKWRGARAGVV